MTHGVIFVCQTDDRQMDVVPFVFSCLIICSLRLHKLKEPVNTSSLPPKIFQTFKMALHHLSRASHPPPSNESTTIVASPTMTCLFTQSYWWRSITINKMNGINNQLVYGANILGGVSQLPPLQNVPKSQQTPQSFPIVPMDNPLLPCQPPIRPSIQQHFMAQPTQPLLN
jgi:hypothetical protein